MAAQKEVELLPEWQTFSELSRFRLDSFLRSKVLGNNYDVVHIHGLWRAPTRIVSRSAASSLPLVISPHGMLSPSALAVSRYKKKLVWHLWEKQSLKSARCLHALSNAEAAVIRDLFPSVPIAVIPNCVRLPDDSHCTVSVAPPWESSIPADESVLLFLGRFHSIKGLDPLLDAWQSVASDAERHRFWLVLIGYGDDGLLARRVLHAQQSGELSRVRVLGPVFGVEKVVALESATAFVLPSFSEALPMAALEAMAHKLPVLLSTACNLPEAFNYGAALPAEPDPSALAASLRRCFLLGKSELEAIGTSGHSLVRDLFSWSQVATQYRELYSWVSGSGTKPSFVYLP